MNEVLKTEIAAINSDVRGVVITIEEAKRDAQRGQNGLDMFDGLEDEDDKKIEHLQGCLNDVTYELDNAKDKLLEIQEYLAKILDEAEMDIIRNNW
tara:strand:- start:65 stop:352 length:288 start_codon:yes stop_codon:yes gene_type:complete